MNHESEAALARAAIAKAVNNGNGENSAKPSKEEVIKRLTDLLAKQPEAISVYQNLVKLQNGHQK